MVRFYRPCKVQFFHGGVKAFVSLCRELHRSEAVDIEVVTAAPIQVQRIEAFGATHCPTYCAWQEVILRFVSASTSGKARTRIKHRRDGAVTITDEYQTHVVATEADLLDFIRAQLAASPCDCLLVDADELVNESSAVGPPVFTVLLTIWPPTPCGLRSACTVSAFSRRAMRRTPAEAEADRNSAERPLRAVRTGAVDSALLVACVSIGRCAVPLAQCRQ